MNIDERLERLVERHEALTLNVELLEKQVETTGGQVRAIATAQLETDAHVRTLARHMAEGMDTINRLGHVAADHDERLDRLENN
jgi:protoporphyrinogen oxidase